jgi:hypothetical protein
MTSSPAVAPGTVAAKPSQSEANGSAATTATDASRPAAAVVVVVAADVVVGLDVDVTAGLDVDVTAGLGGADVAGATVDVVVVVVVVVDVVVVVVVDDVVVVVVEPSTTDDELVVDVSATSSLAARTGAAASTDAAHSAIPVIPNHRTCRTRSAIADLPRSANLNGVDAASQQISAGRNRSYSGRLSAELPRCGTIARHGGAAMDRGGCDIGGVRRARAGTGAGERRHRAAADAHR